MAGNPFSGFYGQSRGQRLFRRGKQYVPMGPWPKGLYNAGPIEDVPQGHLADVLNLDILQNGTLAARRGFHQINLIGVGLTPGIGVGILGSVWDNEDQWTQFFRESGFGSASPLTEILPTKNGVVGSYSTTFTDQRRFTGTCRYGGFVYFLSSTANSSVKATTAAGGVVLTTVAAIPAGTDCQIIKDRMFVVDSTSSRIYYSKATDPTIWTAPDGGFFDVEPGNGQKINAVVFAGTSVYIFKASSTYLFTFTSDPAVDGYLRKIADIGADDALFFEGSIYLINKTGFYRLINTSFELLSAQIDTSVLSSTRLWRLRELIGFNKSIANFSYMYNTRTGAWTKYDFSTFGANTTRKTFTESFDSATGQRLTWVLASTGGAVVQSYNTNLPANGSGDNRDYIIGDSSSLGYAPAYMAQTGLIAPGNGLRLARMFGVVIDTTAKHAYNALLNIVLTLTNNNNKTVDVNLNADVPNHGDASNDGISWSGTTRAYNPTPNTPVAYRVASTGVKVSYAAARTNSSVFNFEIRNIFAIVSADAKEIDKTLTMANS